MSTDNTQDDPARAHQTDDLPPERREALEYGASEYDGPVGAICRALLQTVSSDNSEANS